MRFTNFLRTAAITALAASLLAGTAAAAETRISGPHIHENLAVYLVHGASAAGPVPLTLQEALAKDAVRVIETGSVNELQIENTGTEDVFIQAGDIVKGGRQDRVLTMSLLLAPGSGKLGIGAFCVEQGRWAARGTEDVKRFASANKSIPSREAKLAMALPAKPAPTGAFAGVLPASEPRALRGVLAGDGVAQGAHAGHGEQMAAADTSTRQREVWDKVKRTQDKLSGNLGAAVAAPQSASSLQLSLENGRLEQAQKTYVAALQPAAEKDTDVVGYVVAVNGKLASADVYPSNGLFRKMWAKQLNASVTEAIGEKSGAKTEGQAAAPIASAPAIDAVEAFLAAAEKGTANERVVAGRMKVQTRDADQALLVEASRPDGRLVHRNYLAK